MRATRRRAVCIGVVAAVALGVAVGAGVGASTPASAKQLKVAFLLYGAQNDGGWNLAHLASWATLKKKFGKSLTLVKTDNIPFADAAGQITQRLIDDGANVVIDTVGLAEIFTKVCAKNPKAKCLQGGAVGDLPPNTSGFWVHHWVPAYVAGVTAGLLTKSNTVGFVSPYAIPLVYTPINGFALGCRSVNKKCKVRVVTTNEYFSPPKTVQAANTLIDAGADVLRGYTDDPSYCRAADQRGVWSIPEFWDGSSQCPKSTATSTVWSFADYYADQIRKIQAGTWKQTDFQLIPATHTFKLGKWNAKVPASVRARVTKVLKDLISGKLNPYVGPIKDSKGKLMVKKGEKLSDKFLFSGWKWYVDGVVAG
jgi:basic membrane protein A